MDNYNILGRIGEGAHGVVFKAKQLSTGRVVALKKIPPRRPEEGISNAALREIKALQVGNGVAHTPARSLCLHLHTSTPHPDPTATRQQMEEHENIVSLLAVFTHGTSFVLVFEYMASDLAEVLHTTRGLTEAQVKSYMQMLLRGVAYCHGNHIIHRVWPGVVDGCCGRVLWTGLALLAADSHTHCAYRTSSRRTCSSARTAT